MDYTISIGSNEQRRENMELARRRLTELFSGIRFSEEEETVPLFFHRPNLFSNQVACFASDNPVEEVLPESHRTGSRKEARGEGAGNCTAGYRLVVL